MDPVDAQLRQLGLGVLSVLPDHLISYVTFLLDLEDVVRLACCSRLLRVFACEVRGGAGGRKRWALYPPHTPPPGLVLDDDGEDVHPDDGLTSLQWFLEIYPTLPPERRPIEFVQHPGDHANGQPDQLPNGQCGTSSAATGHGLGAADGVGGGGGAGGGFWEGDLCPEELAVWRRQRGLGRWLRRLWEAQPSTRPAIEACLSKHLHGAFWRELLAAVAPRQEPHPAPAAASAAAAGPDGPCGAGRMGAGSEGPGVPCGQSSGLGLLPLVGADAVVFLLGRVVVKVFTHELPAMRALMCALESHVPRVLLSFAAAATAAPPPPPALHPPGSGCDSPPAAADLLRTMLPQPVSEGPGSAADREEAMREGTEGAAKSAEAVELLYVVERQLQGTHVLLEVWDELGPEQRLGVAEALGRVVGAMHSAAGAAAAAPRGAADDGTAASGAPLGVEGWRQLLRSRAVWHDREDHIWVSGLGAWSESGWKTEAVAPLPATQQQEQQLHAPLANGAAGAATLGTPVDAAADATDSAPAAPAQQGQPACDVPLASEWWPFVQHLRWRQAELLQGLQEAELPAWVKEQLPRYLPADPAQLLGFSPSASVQQARDDESIAERSDGPPIAVRSDGPAVPPLLLHGDVSATNIVLQHPTVAAAALADGHCAVPAAGAVHVPSAAAAAALELRLVDFSDAGHGDPLLELVPVMVSCLGCSRPAMERFWAAYRSSADPRRLWPRRGRQRIGSVGAGALGAGGVCGAEAEAAGVMEGGRGALSRDAPALSYCAMCYCLLHEEAEVMMQRAWPAEDGAGAGAGKAVAGSTPGAVQRPWTLEKLATALWGFLDEP
ncbi:hypothetical protein TSOC_000579 [Tetrabaena socialis]|uniref:F-box domain-containing protein n=1 Tax=Tetrabaena socialis TaxID=47790 RepID=A0A2J8AIY4_9CHLO|nr:hypothetical protein TSOC_000579 [Tetrabaena socialis]|eukprot:PNH12473.1 hypothetical protein TSOC_000579 [Tetrabaena socialis]